MEPPTLTSQFTIRLSSTRHSARLARQLAVQQLTEWTGLPHDSDAAQTVALVNRGVRGSLGLHRS